MLCRLVRVLYEAWHHVTEEREGRSAVVVDIGCNKGYYSARAHKRFAPTESISARTVGQAHKEWLGR